MYLKADDFEIGMLIVGTVATFDVAGDWGCAATTDWRHANKIYRIKAKQLPYIVVEMAWNEVGVCLGKIELIDTRYFQFVKADSEILTALKV